MRIVELIAAWPGAVLLQELGTAYLFVNAAHIIGIALLIGAVLPLDLRLIGCFPTVPRDRDRSVSFACRRGGSDMGDADRVMAFLGKAIGVPRQHSVPHENGAADGRDRQYRPPALRPPFSARGRRRRNSTAGANPCGPFRGDVAMCSCCRPLDRISVIYQIVRSSRCQKVVGGFMLCLYGALAEEKRRL